MMNLLGRLGKVDAGTTLGESGNHGTAREILRERRTKGQSGTKGTLLMQR